MVVRTPSATTMAETPHPTPPALLGEGDERQERPLRGACPDRLVEHLRSLRGRRLDAGDLFNAEILGQALFEIEQSKGVIDGKDWVILRLRNECEYLHHWLKEYAATEILARGRLLRSELLQQASQLPMRDNPPPDSRSPMELVVAEPTAIRALVRHYNWVHDGPDRLLRCRSLLPTAAAPPMAELVEPPGTIADLAAAAALEVVGEPAAAPSRCGGVE